MIIMMPVFLSIFCSQNNPKHENNIIGVHVKIPYDEPQNVFPKWGCVKNFKKAYKVGLLLPLSIPFYPDFVAKRKREVLLKQGSSVSVQPGFIGMGN